jgi:predicted DCC family thiol-disulfide oxidoreductase YuxK
MFKKIDKTAYPPSRPTLYWDENCGFCKYWRLRWELITGGKVDFVPYQEAAENFWDIPLKEFKKASRFIEPDGEVYSGPDSAYRSLYHAGNKKWHRWYKKYPWFRYLSDHGYNHIAKNRPFYFKATKALFGKNPARPRVYWVYYVVVLFVFILLVFVL